MDTIQSIIIGIVEGLTEFLPVSSTGHMIITEKLLHITENDFSKVFTIAIQLGAILAVVVLYWKKFFNFKNWQFYAKITAGVLPALIFASFNSTVFPQEMCLQVQDAFPFPGNVSTGSKPKVNAIAVASS